MGAAAMDAEPIPSSPVPALEEMEAPVGEIPAVEEKEETVKEIKKPLFHDIRRYYCEFCGICRSKKALIRSHILSHHQVPYLHPSTIAADVHRVLIFCGNEFQDEMADGKSGAAEKATEKGQNTCEECGASFRKPAYLKQHMQSHSFQFEKIVDLWREALDPM